MSCDLSELGRRIGGIAFALAAAGDAPPLEHLSAGRIPLAFGGMRFSILRRHRAGDARIGMRFERAAAGRLHFIVEAIGEEMQMNEETLELWKRLPWARETSPPASVDSMPEQFGGTGRRMLSAVCIELGVEIGTVELSLEQLLDLEGGTRIEIELPAEPRVSLVLGGEPFAAGRLIVNEAGAFVDIERRENEKSEQQTRRRFEHVSDDGIVQRRQS